MHCPLPRSVYVVTVVTVLTLQLLPPSPPNGSPPLVRGSCCQRRQLPALLLEYPKHPVSDEHNCSQSEFPSYSKYVGSPPAQSAHLPLPRLVYVMVVVLVAVLLMVAVVLDTVMLLDALVLLRVVLLVPVVLVTVVLLDSLVLGV